MPRTARTSPVRPGKVTSRPWTARIGSTMSCLQTRGRVEGVAQAGAGEVDGEDYRDEQPGGEAEEPRVRRLRLSAVGDQRTERQVGRLDTEAEVRQARLGDH